MYKVGFIGVGNIGTPMASRLLQAGYQMVIYDICKAQTKILQKDGAEVASSPGRLASQCGTILLSLPNSEIVAEVALGVDGIVSGASKGTKIIDLTSGQPRHTISIASRLASKGIGMIDAGVSGSVTAAETGTLSVMAGGNPQLFEQVKPLLRHLANNIIYMGAIGTGHATKSLNNFVFATTYAAVSEALVVGAKAGLDPTKLTAAFNFSSARSWASEDRVPNFLLKRDFGPQGGMTMELMAKDLATACDEGRQYEIPMPLANMMHQLMMQGVSELGNKAANTSITKLYEKWAGIRLNETLVP